MGTPKLGRRWGQAIARQRGLVGLTRSQLAEAVGVTRQAVQQWEQGDTIPHPRNHVAIADALRIHPALLFSYPDPQPDDEEAA